MLTSIPSHALRDELEEDGLREGSSDGETASGLFDGAGFDGFEDEGDPFVEFAGGETAEGVAEGEVAYYVEGAEIEPVD